MKLQHKKYIQEQAFLTESPRVAFYWLFAVFFLFSVSIAIGQNNLVPSTQDCSATRPPFAFDIDTVWTRTGVNNFCTPLAGDLDGDGRVEILVQNSAGTSILIFDGATGTPKGSLYTGTIGGYASNPYLICDVDGDGKAELFVVNARDNSAMLYTVTSARGAATITFGNKWTNSISLPDISTDAGSSVIPAVADLDGDGFPEFVAHKYIIETDGTLVATMNFRGGILGPSDPEAISYVADLDGDGIPEIISGTDVYKYNGSTATLWKRCPSYPNGQDGTNMAADINLDGLVDLVYSDTHLSNIVAGTMVVWTPALAPDPGFTTPSSQGVIGTISPLSTGYRCYPVVGDLDGVVDATTGKKYPEICYNTNNHLHAYSYDGGTSTFNHRFDLPTNEGSGVATFTFFDFNLDGHVELVYRDEQNLHIYECSGPNPVEEFRMPATSNTVIETPIVADVTGDGSADIIVTGSGKLYVFEGKNSKWASCPPVWNQQLYSPLLINTDLTVISHVQSPAWNRQDCSGQTVRLYNGGPMQSPMVSAETFCPVDLAPDIYVVSGSIINTSINSVRLTITFGNQGMVTASASMPIQYYKNAIASGNIIGSETLGVNLAPGQTHTIEKDIINLNPIPERFYVRVQDDGVNFPAAGAYSDCNLTNNTQSFGTVELKMTANSLSACVDGTSIFYVNLINNTHLSGVPTTFNDVILTDSLGTGWEYLTGTPLSGTLGSYNSVTGKMQWTVPSVAPGDTARLIVTAKSTTAGSIRNTAWIESINAVVIGKEVIEAYVIINTSLAPAAATISPTMSSLCASGSALLTSSVTGAGSYQWYRNDVEIPGATQYTYTATTAGSYKVTYFDGTCASQLSSAAIVSSGPCGIPVDITVFLQGPMTSGGTMTNYIQHPVENLCVFTAPRLPVTDPYGTGAVYYNINDVNGTAGAVVDWVKVEIRRTDDPSLLLEMKSLLLKPNGQVVDTLGNTPLFTPQSVPVYLVVRHRNHLSAVNQINDFSGTVSRDFSTSLGVGYRNISTDPDPMMLSNGKWSAWAGDSYKSGTGEMVNNQDHSIVVSSSTAGDRDAYLAGDFNMDGVINSIDISIVESSINTGVFSPVLNWDN